MTYVILHPENGDFVAEFSSRQEAESELARLVDEDRAYGETLGLMQFDADGMPVADATLAQASERPVA